MEVQTKLIKLESLVAPTLSDLGYEVVRIAFAQGARSTLQIMVERKDRVHMVVEDCIRVSRACTTILEVEDPLGGDYLIEVSSPGIDRPLVKLGDFVRFAGEVAKIELSQPLEGRKRFQGRLGGVTAAGEVMLSVSRSVEPGPGMRVSTKRPPRSPSKQARPVIEPQEASYHLPFAAITKARLVVTDELLARFAANQEGGEEPESSQ